MFKKKLMSLGIAVVFTLSSLTTTVFAADFNKAASGAAVTVKVANPGKGNGNGNGNGQNKNNVSVQINNKKENDKKYKFDDCTDITWALNAIEKLAGKGILGGVGQGKFAPRNNVTHVEALAMVMRLTGDNKQAESLGKKVHPSYNGVMPTWGYGYIYLAIEKGILLPEELKDFNPSKPAKRHEIAKYIIRAMGKTEEALKHMDEKLPFKDSSAVPAKSVGYVYLINELKIMSGNNNLFKPMEPVTRAEMAVLLDRAEGKFDLPDTDNRKNGTIFVSADTDDNEITVKVKGTTVTYDVLEGAQVYRDGSFQDIEDLVPGDVLQLTFNADKKVIFIDVLKVAEEVKETELSVTNVDYEDLPEVLQDKVDDLKATKNYKAYEYNDYIYLMATMGKKNTGGYDIVFENVYKVDTNGDFIVKAVIDTDEPSSGDMVTQAVTYPFSVVKFKGFADIDYVRFVDEDQDKLADTEILDINDEAAVEGEIYDIISSSKTIKVEKSNGTKVSYTIPVSAEIIVNGDDDAVFSDLEEGMNVKIEISGDKVIKVTADDSDADEDELSVEVVDYSDLSSRLKEQVDYLKLGKNYKAYEYNNYVYLIATMGRKNSDDYKIDIDEVTKVKNGTKYTIKAEVEIDTPSSTSGNDTVYPYSIVRFKQFDGIDVVRFIDEDNDKLAETRVVELDEIVDVEGVISYISSSSRTIKVEKSNGSVVTLTIPNDAEITVNDDENEAFSDLEKGMKVEIEIVDERVTKVVAEDNITEVKGILTGISISTEKKITLKVGSTSKIYTVPSDVKVVIDGATARIEDLRVNSELTLKFSNGLLVEIEKE